MKTESIWRRAELDSDATGDWCGLETLEPRLLLSATVQLDPLGDPTFQGDAGADVVILRENLVSGRLEYSFDGIDFSADLDPLTPGVQAVTAAGANVIVDLGAGEDRLEIRDSAQRDAFKLSDGSASVGAEQPLNVVFRNTETIVLEGLEGADLFRVDAGAGGPTENRLEVRGGDGVDTLIGADQRNMWTITGRNAGELDRPGGSVIAFSGIENLTGGDGPDRFVFEPGGYVNGTVDGGGGANSINEDPRLGIRAVAKHVEGKVRHSGHEGTAGGEIGDINLDGVVNESDLELVIDNWGSCPDPPGTCAADVNGDGAVNVLDLVLVFENWTVDDGALHAEIEPPVTQPTAEPLTEAQLEAMVAAAAERWMAWLRLRQGGLDLEAVTFRIVDLPGLMVGRATGHTVFIDPTAAGHGWFIDATPLDDAEFDRLEDGRLEAGPTSPADGRIDLFTAVAHELGHLAGLDDLPAIEGRQDVMIGTLGQGARRVAGAWEVISTPGETAGGMTGDLNLDGVVNEIDLNLVLATWGACPGVPGFCGDANADGAVNVLDLVLVVEHWSDQDGDGGTEAGSPETPSAKRDAAPGRVVRTLAPVFGEIVKNGGHRAATPGTAEAAATAGTTALDAPAPPDPVATTPASSVAVQVAAPEFSTVRQDDQSTVDVSAERPMDAGAEPGFGTSIAAEARPDLEATGSELSAAKRDAMVRRLAAKVGRPGLAVDLTPLIRFLGS